MTIADGIPSVFVKHGYLSDELQSRIRNYNPKTDFGALVKRVARALPKAEALELLDGIQRTVIIESKLRVQVYRANPSTGRPWPKQNFQPISVRQYAEMTGLTMKDAMALIEDYGIVSRKVITNAGIDFLIADWAGGASDINLFKFHGLGTAVTAEAATQTALTTELTTQYNPDNTRATGTAVAQTGPTPDTILLSGTNTLDASATIEEHAIFSATTAGTMWDRSLTGTQTLLANDALKSDYTLTANAGG